MEEAQTDNLPQMKRRKKEEDKTIARIWCFLTFEERRKLNVRLASMNMRTSEWMRGIVKQFLDKPMLEDIVR